MSAQPIWITPPGPLQGPIPEGTYFQVPLQVSDTATLNITGITSTGVSITVTFAIQPTKPFQVGDTVILANVTPTNYNGSYAITSSTVSQITFNSNATGVWAEGTGTVASVPSTVYFEVVAGSLPDGVECTTDGIVQGVPSTISSATVTPIDITGAFGNGATVTLRFAPQPTIPYPLGYVISVSGVNPQSFNGTYFVVIACSTTSVSYASSATGIYIGGGEVVSGFNLDTTSKFAIRAYTKTNLGTVNRFADNTFTLTVEGQNLPQWITPAGQIGQYWDGELLQPGIQLLYTNDNTTGVPPPIKLISGRLPPGITVSDTGLISGFVGLNPAISAVPGFSRNEQGFDEYPFDFNAQTVSANYEFTLQVTDGRTSSQRTFSMFVWATNVFLASTTLITVDNTYLTASISTAIVPVINNLQGSIGTAPSDTFFAYQFTGQDINGDQIAFIGTFLPPGLTLNATTGWLYGYLPQLGLTENIYNFIVQAYLYSNSSIVSDPYQYSLTVTGPISTAVTWITPSNLGSIANGATSVFYVRATTTANLALQYRLASGSDSRLPQGLTLQPSGDIVGRVSFNTFAVDGGTTTFDVRDYPYAVSVSTTFDLTFTFTVNVYTENGYVNVYKTFTIRLIKLYDKPYYNLYIQCMPPYANRDLISNLLENINIFPPALLYRTDDYNFSVSSNITYWHAYGLNAVTLDTYVEALQLNHYWKNLTLGQIKTAQAIDPVTNEVLYEVVYSEIIDTLVNNDDIPADKEVVLAYPIDANTPEEIDVVFPNPLDQMRNQVIDVVGQESNLLPLWMQTRQADGSVLGFTRAWVIAYTQPGKSGQIAYNISTQFTGNLNTIDFEADRYELDNALTVNWDAENQHWIPSPPLSTTFDINYHYNVYINDGGLGYADGNMIRLIGADIGAPVISADSLSINFEYTITTIGTTNWVDIGANSTAVVTGIISDGSNNTGSISGVAIDEVEGRFTFTSVAGNIVVGQCVTISGTNTGTGYIISPTYTNPNTYYVIDTDNASYFVLSDTLSGNAITTYAGSTSGWTFNLYGGNVLNVESVTSGSLDIGIYITGSNITPGTYITNFGSGTGGNGTYLVNFPQLVNNSTTITGQPIRGTTFISTGAGTGSGFANFTLNDCIIDVDTVNNTGVIINAFYAGTSTILAAGNEYNGIAGVDITGTGTGALWDIIVVPGLGAADVTRSPWANDSRQLVVWTNDTSTITAWTDGTPTIFDTQFDGGSLTFNDPADINTNTDAYNKYLMYPKQNILG